MATFSNNLGAKGANEQTANFYCEICDYKCCKKYSWERHLSTTKHTKSIDGNGLATKRSKRGNHSHVSIVANNIRIDLDYGDTKKSVQLK